MKLASFIGIVLSVLFISVATMYIEKIGETRNVYNEELFSAETNNQRLVRTLVGAHTVKIGLMSIGYFLFAMAVGLLSFIQYRKMIFMLSGLVCSTGMFVWTIVMMNNPLGISFDEVGPVWIVMALIQIVVFISALKETLQQRPNSMQREFSVH